MEVMWLDDRGSEILTRNECVRLLTLSAGSVGHLGLIVNDQPLVLPINFGMAEGNPILQIGTGSVLEVVLHNPLVAYEVDYGPGKDLLTWSVLVQGPAEVVGDPAILEAGHYWGPHPIVPEPGDRYVRIRPWSVTGRRFTATAPLRIVHAHAHPHARLSV